MTGDLRRQLVRLESLRPRRSAADDRERDVSEATVAIVDAFYLGGWRPGDDLMSGLAAACESGDHIQRVLAICTIAGRHHISAAALAGTINEQAESYRDLWRNLPDEVTDADLEAAMRDLPRLHAVRNAADAAHRLDARRRAGFQTVADQGRAVQ